jgi:hypothetical protein
MLSPLSLVFYMIALRKASLQGSICITYFSIWVVCPTHCNFSDFKGYLNTKTSLYVYTKSYQDRIKFIPVLN